jgi:hypothetical protein
MPDALVVLKGLWVCSLVLQAMLVVRIFETNLAFRFLWFAIYLAAEVASGLVLSWTPIQSAAYVQVWGVTQPVLCFFRLALAWEIVRRHARGGPRRTPLPGRGAAAGIVFAVAMGCLFAVRAEQTLRWQAWQNGIVLMAGVGWAIVAVSMIALWAIGGPRRADRNTTVHMWLLFALAGTEIVRYGLAMWSRGALLSALNIGAVVAECILYLLWIVLLKEDSESDALRHSVAA